MLSKQFLGAKWDIRRFRFLKNIYISGDNNPSTKTIITFLIGIVCAMFCSMYNFFVHVLFSRFYGK